ncbi:uncharacterized protein EAF01_006334 [Botrytis porri]|uniref:Carrier domain-containing protein n=1 Tax=Botrytis porri TaxID=87229 RepID=A0A4Z1L3S8_9HELO|nr:uncharacterized protein EAF01_006334 [Botrytis porri]KAF7903285.1 hypothetical protein EAF01_006334 [Botrytis porri]TGO91223.1 hypothetical protein BPOR_0035g00240 [Botrytis porri]
MAPIAPGDLNYFTCTLGEASSRRLTPVDEYDTINELLDHHAEKYGDQLAIAIPEEIVNRKDSEGNSFAGSSYGTERVLNGQGASSSSSNGRKETRHASPERNPTRVLNGNGVHVAGAEAAPTEWKVHLYNFQELRDCSLKLSHKLASSEELFPSDNVTARDSTRTKCVGLMGKSDFAFLFSWLALMRLGVSVMVMVPSLSSEAVRHLCKQCDIDIVFYDVDLLQQYAEIQKLENISRSTPLQMRGYSRKSTMELISHPERIPSHIPSYKVTGKTPAYNHHTSGTSGLPKPVPYTHHVACGVLPILDGRGTLSFTTTPLYTGGIADCLRAWTSLSIICLAPDGQHPLTSETIINCFSQIKEKYESSIRRVHKFGTRPRSKSLTLRLANQIPKSIYFSCVPTIAQMLSTTSRGLEFLRSMDIVGVGGASLSEEDGKLLVSEGINLVSRYGSAECSFLLSTHRDYKTDKEWQYFRAVEGVDSLKFEPLNDGSNRYELVVMSDWPQFPKANREDGCFATSDLFEPHHSIENAWKHVGRGDAQITLSTGKKFDPIYTEEALKRFPDIKDAFVFGNGQMYPGVIIIKSSNATSNFTDDEFRDMIWPYVKDVNKTVPPHAKIYKDMLVLKPHTDSLEKTAKGTTKRQSANMHYEPDIKSAYDGDASAFNSEVSLESVMEVVKTAIGAPIDLQYDSNFRAHHIDSVQATRIRSHLNLAFLRGSKPFPWNLVYQCGSVTGLTEYIKASQNGSIPENEKDEVHQMNSMVEQYSRSFKDETKSCNTPEEETIIVTGVTGTLGMNIVELLRFMTTSHEALRIVCFVRAKNDEEARERVEWALQSHYPENLEFNAPNIECRAVKLDQNELGLSRDVLKDLRQNATTIIHAAWEVNFSIPLKDFTEQFQGLRNLIDFSLSGEAPKHLVFCSSTASVANTKIEENEDKEKDNDEEDFKIIESINRNPLDAGPLGYSKSKWVAEAICSSACQMTRANISIVRIGQLSGNTFNGSWNEKEAWPLMLSTGGPECLNSLPELDIPLSWLPVNTAAAAVIEIACQKISWKPLQPRPSSHEASVFHLVNNSTDITWRHLLKWIGHEGKTEEFEKWLQRAKSPSPVGLKENHPARSLLGFWKDMEKQSKEDSTRKATFGLLRTRQVSETMRDFTDIDEEYVKTIWGWVQAVARKWADENNGEPKKKASSLKTEESSRAESPVGSEASLVKDSAASMKSDDDEGVSGINVTSKKDVRVSMDSSLGSDSNVPRKK